MTLVKKTLYGKGNHALFFNENTDPETTVSEASINFGTVMLREKSAAQMFVVSGNNLAGNVTVTAPSGFIINTDASNNDASPIVLVPGSGAINQVLYCKFAPEAYQTYGPVNLTVTAAGVSTKNIALQGNGTLQTNLRIWYDGLSGAKPTQNLTYALQGLWKGFELDNIIAQADLWHVILGLETDEQILTPVLSTKPTIAVGTPTLDDDGFAGDGATSYINLNWKPALDAQKYTRDDASIFTYCRSSAGASGKSGSIETGRNTSTLNPLDGAGDLSYAINEAVGSPSDSFSRATAKGLIAIKRTPAGTQAEIDGALVYSNVSVSDLLNTIDEYLGATNNNGSAAFFDNRQYCFYGRGSSLIVSGKVLYRLQLYAAEIGKTL